MLINGVSAGRGVILFVKQVRVRSCADKFQYQYIVLFTVNQEPIRLDVKFSMPGPISSKSMIPILVFKRGVICEL